MDLIKIEKEELEEIIYNNITQMLEQVKFPNDEDANICLGSIMEEISKTSHFKVWRR